MCYIWIATAPSRRVAGQPELDQSCVFGAGKHRIADPGDAVQPELARADSLGAFLRASPYFTTIDNDQVAADAIRNCRYRLTGKYVFEHTICVDIEQPVIGAYYVSNAHAGGFRRRCWNWRTYRKRAYALNCCAVIYVSDAITLPYQ